MIYPPRPRKTRLSPKERIQRVKGGLAKLRNLGNRLVRSAWRRWVLRSLWRACERDARLVHTRALVYLGSWVDRHRVGALKDRAQLQDLLALSTLETFRSERQVVPQPPPPPKTLVTTTSKPVVDLVEMEEAFQAEREAWMASTRGDDALAAMTMKRLEETTKQLEDCRQRSDSALARSKDRVDAANAALAAASDERDALARRNVAVLTRGDHSRLETVRLQEEIRALKRERASMKQRMANAVQVEKANDRARLEQERREYFELLSIEERHKRHLLAQRGLSLLPAKYHHHSRIHALLQASVVPDDDDNGGEHLLLLENGDDPERKDDEDARWIAIRAGIDAMLDPVAHGRRANEAPEDLAEACATREPLTKALEDLCTDKKATTSGGTRHAKRIALARLALACQGMPLTRSDLTTALHALDVSVDRVATELPRVALPPELPTSPIQTRGFFLSEAAVQTDVPTVQSVVETSTQTLPAATGVELRDRLARAAQQFRTDARAVADVAKRSREADQRAAEAISRARAAEARYALKTVTRRLSERFLRRAWSRWRIDRGRKLAAAVLRRRGVHARLRGVLRRWRSGVRDSSMTFEPATLASTLEDDDDDETSSMHSVPPPPPPQRAEIAVLEQRVKTLAAQNHQLALALRSTPRDASVAKAEIRVLQARLDAAEEAVSDERQTRQLEVARLKEELKQERESWAAERARTAEKIQDDANTITDLTDRSMALELELRERPNIVLNRKARDAFLMSQHAAADLVLHARRRHRRHRSPPDSVATATTPDDVVQVTQERAAIADLLDQNATLVAEVVGCPSPTRH